MKKLHIPYIDALNGVALSAAATVMELRARRESIDVLNWREAFPYKPVVAFDIARGTEDLYIHYFVRGLSLRAVAGRDGEYVHPDSCVEFFMRRDGETDYINFEFNCIGTCYAARHHTRTDATPLTPDEFRSIRRHTTLPRAAFAEKKGIHAWELTVAIPFRLMGLDPLHLPERFFGNFYKCADETANPHYVTWNPIDLPQPDYHCPAFFGELRFMHDAR
ncbi:MAG: hypothetical protein LBP64_10640 [Tannerella sp.]|jgi:hypothetical protein|nr:hypothetical protein [Tannerella sp.]